MIEQIEFRLPEMKRGFHLVTRLIMDKLPPLPDKGILNLHIKHTSAALSLNENADPSVRVDFNSFVNRMVPENEAYFTHTLEGADDMPAHIKSSLFGQNISMPISHGRLNLGTWQGIYFCEFRNGKRSRKLVLTVYS